MPQLCSLKTRYKCTVKPVLSSWLNIFSSITLVPRNKLLITDIWTVLLEYIHNCLSMLTVLLGCIDSHTPLTDDQTGIPYLLMVAIVYAPLITVVLIC